MFKIDTAIDATGYRKPVIIINVEGDEWEESIDRSDKLELVAAHPERNYGVGNGERSGWSYVIGSDA